MTNISIIIPIFNLQNERLNNFNFILQRLSKLNVPIFVSEQNSRNQIIQSNVTHLNLSIDDNQIHKSSLINYANTFIKTKYLWMIDADCCLKFQEVLSFIDDQDVIKPFRYIIPLTQYETDELIKNDSLHLAKSKRKISIKFGPYSFIIKKEIFDKIGKMDENFKGYGWEDLEFANRVRKQYNIFQIDLSGLHLNHPKPIENLINKKIYLTAIENQLALTVDKININNLLIKENHDEIGNLLVDETKENHDEIEIDNLLIEENKELINPLIKKEIKHKELGINKILQKKLNIDKLIQKTEIVPSRIDLIIQKLINHFENKNQSHIEVIKSKIIHAIAPALLESKTELYNREMLTIQSIINQKEKCKDFVITVIISNNPNAQKFKDDFIIVPPLRTAQELGDKKDIPYISDIFKIMSNIGDDETVLFYTNSDCCIGENTYQKILKYDKQAIEYHRNDILNNPQTLEEVFKNESIIHNKGIDGLALSKVFYEINKQYVSDFFIGEPHWDTAIGGFLRNFNLSILNITDLYHPKHEKTWDLNNLTNAGKHNTDLYREFLEYGFLKSHILELPIHYNEIDTNVVIVHFGKDDIRVNAARTALEWLSIQELPVEYIFVEMVYNNEEGAFEHLKNRKNFKYIKINGNEQNKILWQKEAMMNIGGKACTKKYVMFLDSDVYSKHANWFNRIRDYLELNNKTLLQVFKFCTDSIYNDQMFISMAAKWNNYDADLPHNPGLGIALCRDVLVENNYFNPYCLYGSGDTFIIAEYCKHDSFLFKFDKLNNIKRSLPVKCDIDYIDEDIIHENHGKLVSLDYYKDRHEVSKQFSKDIRDLISIGENGLLNWNDINCSEKQLIEELYKNKFK